VTAGRFFRWQVPLLIQDRHKIWQMPQSTGYLHLMTYHTTQLCHFTWYNSQRDNIQVGGIMSRPALPLLFKAKNLFFGNKRVWLMFSYVSLGTSNSLKMFCYITRHQLTVGRLRFRSCSIYLCTLLPLEILVHIFTWPALWVSWYGWVCSSASLSSQLLLWTVPVFL
jgi:hypothetical protein